MELWTHCPICEQSLSMDDFSAYFQIKYCLDCQYEYRQQGSYASLVILEGQQFWFDDGCSEDDQKKFDSKIQEIKNRT